MQALSLAAYDIQLAGRFADAVGGAPDQSALICSVLNEEPELQGGRSAVDRQDRAHASPISFLLHVDSILIRLRRDQSEVDAHGPSVHWNIHSDASSRESILRGFVIRCSGAAL